MQKEWAMSKIRRGWWCGLPPREGSFVLQQGSCSPMVLGLQLPSLFGTWISRESENIRVRFRFCIAARTLNSSLPWTSLNTYLVLSLYLTSGVSVSKKHCASLWKSSKFMTLCGKLSGIWWQGLQKWYCGIQWLPIGYSSTFPKFGTCTIDTRK